MSRHTATTPDEPDPPVLDIETLDPSEESPRATAQEHKRDQPGAAAGKPSHGPIKSGRLAGLTMQEAIWVLAWPVLCESVLNSLVGLVDTKLSARISQDATDAVASAAYVLWFMGLIAMAIGVGATALISRSMGAGRPAVARAALGQAIILSAICGIGAGLALWLTAPMIASLLHLDAGATADFIAYQSALAWGTPGLLVLAAGNACARGAGDTVRPLLTMVVVNIVNFCAAFTLAYWLGLGVQGIGFGTAIAHTVGAVLIVLFHAQSRSALHLKRRWIKPHAVTIYRLVRLGIPNFLETFGMWVVNFAVILMVGWMSAASAARHDATVVGESGGLLGAHMIAIRLEAFSFLPGFAMGIAASALAGQYLGAGAPQMAKRGALICAGIAAAMMGMCGIVFLFFGKVLVELVSTQPAHVAIAPQLLFITGITQVPFALSIVFRSTMQGAGDTRAVMIMTWVSQWMLRLPLAYAISGVEVPLPAWLGGGMLANPFPFKLGLPGLWIGLTGELTIRCLLYSARFWDGGWMKARV